MEGEIPYDGITEADIANADPWAKLCEPKIDDALV